MSDATSTETVRVGAIDCGTNSIRLLVADIDPGTGALADVLRRMEIVRLGHGGRPHRRHRSRVHGAHARRHP